MKSELDILLEEESRLKKLLAPLEEEVKKIREHNKIVKKQSQLITSRNWTRGRLAEEFVQKNHYPKGFSGWLSGKQEEFKLELKEYIDAEMEKDEDEQLYRSMESWRKYALPDKYVSLKKSLTEIRQKIREIKQEEKNKEAREREKKRAAKRQEKDAKLARYEKKSRRQAKYLVSDIRKKEQENWKCPYCNKEDDLNHSHVDHIYPVSKGGLSVKENMVLICEKCNLKKGDESLRSFCKKEKFIYSKVCERLENLGKFI